MVVLENKLSSPSPNDIVFVVEGTALCGAYLNELKQAYILPTLEYFNGGPLDEKECGSASNYAIYGLVIFHAADILPGYLTEAHGPITTPHKLITTLDKIQFAGGHGEAASHIGEGLAIALQCLQDITNFRNPPLEIPAKKHVILICNCKPYGLPVTESVGSEGHYRGMTAEQLAALMHERGIHLSIMAPRKIPALISLFDRSGGESSSQKTYARDVRHLVLLNGFHLQERPITPKQVPDVPVPAIMNPPPPSAPISQPQVTTSTNAPLPHPPTIPQHQPQQQQTSIPIPSQPQQQQQQPPQQQQQPQQPQPLPPQPVAPAPPPPVQVQPPPPPVSSHQISTPSSIVPPSSMHQTSMAMSTAATVSMAQTQAGNTMSPMIMNQTQNNMGMNLHPPQQQPSQQPNQHQPMIVIRNRPPMQMQNIRHVQIQNQQMNPTQQLNPNQIGPTGQPIGQVQMNTPGGPQQMNSQMLGSQQMLPNQVQMNITQQQQQQQQLNQQLSQQLQSQQQQQQQQMNQPINPQQMGQQFLNQSQLSQQLTPQQMNAQQLNPQQMNPQQMNQQQLNAQQMNQQQLNTQQMNQQQINQLSGQTQMTASILGPRLMAGQLSQQQPQVSQAGQPQQQSAAGHMARWPNQMSTASTMQQMQKLQPSQSTVPLVRMTNVNQPQVPTSGQPLQAQMSIQQPILSTGVQQPSALQQQLQQSQQQSQQQQQSSNHSTLLAQLKIPPIGSQQPPQQPPPQQQQQQSAAGGLLSGGGGGPPAMANQKERHTIWSGTLEWHEKPKGPPDGQKVLRQVPCKVSAYVVNGEPEVKGDGWPPKLIMQLIPKNIVGSLGGSFLVQNVKTVVFLLQNCDALNSLTRVMDSGYAGCVHFTGAAGGMQPAACNIKVLILLYSKERQTYLGFIPNDQVGFVDRIRKVIQQQKQQQTTRQLPVTGIGGMSTAGLMPGQQPGPGGMIQGQQSPLVQSQAGMLQGPPQPGMVQQTSMVQAQQTPISSLAQQLGQTSQVSMAQSPVTALAQQLGQAQQLQQQLQQQQQQQQMQNPGMGGNLDGSQNPSDPVNQHLEMERQQNLLTIQQLQQTLQAAQQKELQYQQLQQHPVPGQHPQQAGPGPAQIQVQVGQQQIMQGAPGQQQLQQVPRQLMNPQAMNQIRMMRSSVSQANPGLKHLLQQQPGPQNYRMQLPMQQQRMPGQMGMPGQMQGPGGPMQPNQQVPPFEEVGILDLLK